MTRTAPRTLPQGFMATLADRSMDNLTVAHGICYERAVQADPGSNARTLWQNRMKAISDHAIFERNFRIYRVDQWGEWIFEPLGVG